MKNLSFKLLLPVAAFVLASAGAVSTSSSGKKADSTVAQGWNRIAPFNCVEGVECNNIGDAVCVDVANIPMYGKLSEFSDCTQLLTHEP